MLEITSAQISNDLPAFLTRALPMSLRCCALLQGNEVGRIWIDDPVHSVLKLILKLLLTFYSDLLYTYSIVSQSS